MRNGTQIDRTWREAAYESGCGHRQVCVSQTQSHGAIATNLCRFDLTWKGSSLVSEERGSTPPSTCAHRDVQFAAFSFEWLSNGKSVQRPYPVGRNESNRSTYGAVTVLRQTTARQKEDGPICRANLPRTVPTYEVTGISNVRSVHRLRLKLYCLTSRQTHQ